MLENYYSMKLAEFFKRWHISSDKWQKLKKLWGLEGKRKKTKPEKSPSATKVDKGKRVIFLGTFVVEKASVLSAFPAFDKEWSEPVQLRWLDVYRLLVQGE